VKGHIEPDNDGTEFHAEAYYRIALNEHVALTPDLQWVVNPVGNGDNDAVFAGMIRVELSF
ncbi:MAG: carbohydrate porin, partial [Deltaproteobacteria bacterium]|nr:carbohydrate porin [Deltaproteobacteria bacterium]